MEHKMTILIVNNKGQYNHRIARSLQYLQIPSELVSNELSIEEIEAKNPIGLILGGGPSLEGAGMSEEYIIEMLNITKRFPGIVANDNITLQLKK